jgi:multidrug efflux pump subunit AcrA (membrane-fusion protein)
VKILIILVFLTTFLFAKTYYSKIEPYELRYIASNVSGLVEYIDENLIGKKLSSKAYIKIDSKLDKQELGYLKEKLTSLENTVLVNENILQNMKETLLKKRKNYKQIEALKIKSRVEKDREFYELVASENSYLATQKEINSLKRQIADFKLRKAQLERSIKDKYLSNKGFVLYSIEVKVGQVVKPSTPLAKIADTSKAILTIYLDEDDLVELNDKVIYIDDKKTNYKMSRVSFIADAKNISKYKAQIIIDAPKVFSRLAKIDLLKGNNAH